MKRLLLSLAITVCLGCNAKTSIGPPPSRLVVAAAANLSEAFPEMAQRFSNQTGIPVVFSFGATADLAKQIENGAPYDVFAAADTTHIDALDSKGLLTPGTRSLYARGKLVMWSPTNVPGADKLEDIVAPAFERIAVAKPDVAPYGRATVEALQHLGIWQQIQGKVVYGQSVAQTKQFAATGNAEVAFIPLALVKPGEGTMVSVDESLHQPIDQAIAVVNASPNQAAARQFVNFILSAEGQELLSNKGYSSIRRP